MLVIFKEYKDIQKSWKDARTQADMNNFKKKTEAPSRRKKNHKEFVCHEYYQSSNY